VSRRGRILLQPQRRIGAVCACAPGRSGQAWGRGAALALLPLHAHNPTAQPPTAPHTHARTPRAAALTGARRSRRPAARCAAARRASSPPAAPRADPSVRRRAAGGGARPARGGRGGRGVRAIAGCYGLLRARVGLQRADGVEVGVRGGERVLEQHPLRRRRARRARERAGVRVVAPVVGHVRRRVLIQLCDAARALSAAAKGRARARAAARHAGGAGELGGRGTPRRGR